MSLQVWLKRFCLRARAVADAARKKCIFSSNVSSESSKWHVEVVRDKFHKVSVFLMKKKKATLDQKHTVRHQMQTCISVAFHSGCIFLVAVICMRKKYFLNWLGEFSQSMGIPFLAQWPWFFLWIFILHPEQQCLTKSSAVSLCSALSQTRHDNTTKKQLQWSIASQCD